LGGGERREKVLGMRLGDRGAGDREKREQEV